MGLKVDQPKSGSGTTNDGNMVRKLSNNVHILVELFGLHLSFNLQYANYSHCFISLSVNRCNSVRNLSNATAKLYVKTYRWYLIPLSVHKMLIHRTDIIKNSILSTGRLEEEVSERRHKNYKQ